MITTLKGDITQLDFDIIVNAANSDLLAGTGVCGAIFHKAGHGLQEACQKIGHCDIGQVVLTPAFDLPCQAIIHAVGPIYVDGNHKEDEYLEACYWNVLCVAYDWMREKKLSNISLAFPCISTGIYGYPHEEACKIAVKTVRQLMRRYPDAQKIDVIFVCYQQEDYALYKKELSLR